MHSCTHVVKVIFCVLQRVLNCASTMAKKVLWYAIPPRLHELTAQKKKRQCVNRIMKAYIASVNNFLYINLEVWEHLYVVTWIAKMLELCFRIGVKFLVQP